MLGIDKDSANVAIRKYSLYLEYENKGVAKAENILTLPNRAVKTLTGHKKENFNDNEIIEVITSDNPSSKLKEIVEYKDLEKMSHVEERKVYLLRERTRKLHLIEKIRKEVLEIEKELNSLT